MAAVAKRPSNMFALSLIFLATQAVVSSAPADMHSKLEQLASKVASQSTSAKNHTAVYNPELSVHFVPTKSVSYKQGKIPVPFTMTYADSSVLSGYVCHDIVQLGRYHVPTRFGCIRHCVDPHFNGVDGILGLGLQGAAEASVPTPLFTRLSSQFENNDASTHPLKTPKFAIVSTENSAELQLGGVEPSALLASMVRVPTTSSVEYSVSVESLKLGGIELLNFKKPLGSLPAILDSGTSCLVLPDSSVNGLLQEPPMRRYEQIKDNVQGLSIYVTIKGHLFEIPFWAWWRKVVGQPCIQAGPPGFNGLLLGDVFFRAVVVEFDLTHAKTPMIGLAPRNPLYNPLTPEEAAEQGATVNQRRVPMIKRTAHGIEIVRDHKPRKGVDRLPLIEDPAQTVLFVNVSVGTPRQTFTVFVDTGSSILAVFARPAPEGARSALHLAPGEVIKLPEWHRPTMVHKGISLPKLPKNMREMRAAFAVKGSSAAARSQAQSDLVSQAMAQINSKPVFVADHSASRAYEAIILGMMFIVAVLCAAYMVHTKQASRRSMRPNQPLHAMHCSDMYGAA